MIAGVISVIGSVAQASALDPAALEFFEKKIRPILADHCYKCHSSQSEKIKGGLLLDSREPLLKGGNTGPAITPGDPDRSLLIKAVRYTSDDLQMPPKGKKLSAEQIADLETWVKMGAPDPRADQSSSASAKAAADKKSKASEHWAFRPIAKPSIPIVKNKKWVKTPVDAFILAKLESQNLTPSPMADKRTLIRRATFDLTGLPPTPDEVDKFVADRSSNAYEKLVDRLLASPRYGERWGRHWLDVARYADTKGYMFEEERRFPYSYTYRDYVIRAFNEDLPYNQFITQQIAADLLPLGEDKRPLAALGFLTLGRRFLNNQTDIIDDRIDVVMRGTMALTVGCARCHDHKYDPIPTKDYYSLYGVFASCTEPKEEPLIGEAAPSKEHSDYLAEHEKRVEALANYRTEKEKEMMTKLRSQAGDYLLALHDIVAVTNSEKHAVFIQERGLSQAVADHWKTHLDSLKTNDAIFGPWLKLAALEKTNFVAEAKTINAKLQPPLRVALFTNSSPTNLEEVASRYDKLFSEIDQRWNSLLKTNSDTNAPKALPDADAEALRQVLYAETSPLHLEHQEIQALFDIPTAQETRRLQREIDGLDATHPGAPPRAMVLNDSPDPVTPHVLKRGNPANPGDEVPRQFLSLDCR